MIRLTVSHVPGACAVCGRRYEEAEFDPATTRETDYMCGLIDGVFIGKEEFCQLHGETLLELLEDEGVPVMIYPVIDADGQVRR